jgi:hypothetical protein
MPSPEAAPRIIGRLFRADGDHITDLKIPAFNRPVDVLLWHSRISPIPCRRLHDAPLCRLDRILASYL